MLGCLQNVSVSELRAGIDCWWTRVLAVVDAHCEQDALDLRQQWCFLEDLAGVVDGRPRAACNPSVRWCIHWSP